MKLEINGKALVSFKSHDKELEQTLKHFGLFDVTLTREDILCGDAGLSVFGGIKIDLKGLKTRREQ